MRTTLRTTLLSLPLMYFGAACARDANAATCADPAWCVTNVTRDRISSAWSGVASWQTAERQRAYFTATGLAAMPLEGTVLKPIASGYKPTTRSFTNIYGNKKILFTLRSASQFLKGLFPQLDTLTLLRVDTDYPIRPQPPGGDVDEHTNGKAADIAYPQSGTGTNGTIDLERTFWLVYAFSKTPGVFEVIIDYWDEVASYGRLAVEQGLITQDELTHLLRIARADKFRNHDTHMHIDVET